jgi:hypothetical protein
MKLLDILESQTNEAPMGFVSKALSQAGAKVLPGTMGLKQQGKLATGDLANNLYNEYAQFLGKTRLPPNGDSIKKFLQTKNVDPSYVDAHLPDGTVRLSSGKLENVFLTITRDIQSGSPRAPAATPPSPTSTPTVVPTPAADAPVTFAQIMSSLHTLSYTDLRNLKRQLDLTLAPP